MTKKPTINTVTSGWTSADTLNSNLEALRDAFENTISRDGSTPNSMEADLDLNDYDLLNVGEVDATTLRIGGQLVNIADLVSVEETYLNSMSLAYIYATVAELVASTDTYTTFSENDYVIANGYLYQVAASVATDHNLSNAGGVKYYVRSVNNTMYVDAFNLAGSGDET